MMTLKVTLVEERAPRPSSLLNGSMARVDVDVDGDVENARSEKKEKTYSKVVV
jgi:hypothetical protein